MASFAIIGLTTTSTIWFICCKQDDDEDDPEGCQWYLVDALFVYIQSQVLSLEEWLFLLIKRVSIRGCSDAMNRHVSSLTLFCVYTPQLILGHRQKAYRIRLLCTRIFKCDKKKEFYQKIFSFYQPFFHIGWLFLI